MGHLEPEVSAASIDTASLTGESVPVEVQAGEAVFAGSLNLRGRIVTAIDVRTRLKLPKNTDGKESMSVVVDQGGHATGDGSRVPRADLPQHLVENA